MKKIKDITMLAECTVDCSCCDRVVLHIKGYVEDNGTFNPDIGGNIQFDDLKHDKHIKSLKKGKHYHLTISKVAR
jgi:hypothetical protein